MEATVVFGDREDAARTLQRMLVKGVASASVQDAQGMVFARWQGPDRGMRGAVGARLARLAALPPSTAPIQHDGQRIGEIVLHSDGLGLLHFLLTGAAAFVASPALSGSVGIALSRRMLRDLVTPLRRLADVARATRHGQTRGLRVAPARIAELRAC